MLLLSQEKMRSRTPELQNLFSALIRFPPAQVFWRSHQTQIFTGLGPDNVGTNLREARHPSRVKEVFINYFEVWNSLEGGKRFVLDRAYFHLDIPRADGTGDEELLALHCDPNTDPSDPSYSYKRGPHMHLAFKRYDFHKSHIALCIQNIEKTCSDFRIFSEAFADLIEMINREFLERLELNLQ